MVKVQELKEFVKHAKENTFAAGASPVDSSRSGSTDFQYEEGDYQYRDSFLGDKKDVGEELVWLDEEPIWGMNYRGGMRDGHTDELDDVFGFLKEALSEVPQEHPYRGPPVLRSEDLTYVNEFEGDILNFTGQEKIYQGKEIIYDRIYHGGSIE